MQEGHLMTGCKELDFFPQQCFAGLCPGRRQLVHTYRVLAQSQMLTITHHWSMQDWSWWSNTGIV